MKNKTTLIIAAVLGLIVIGGGVLALSNSQNDTTSADKMAMEKEAEHEAMMKKDESAAMEAEAMAKEEDAMVKEDEAMENGEVMSKHGSYVTLADYNADPSKYADSKKVYFFHASWCPICKSIDEEISSDTSAIPTGVTMIKTDFDSATDLRKKYGVTTQYTFVQVDDNGNETAQWSATSLAKALDGIES